VSKRDLWYLLRLVQLWDVCADCDWVVCAQRRFINDGKAEFAEWIAIAGDFEGGKKLDENVTLFGALDEKKKGLRVTLHGGTDVEHERSAVIDFVCDLERTGLEGSKAVTKDAPKMKRRDDKKEDDKSSASLKYVSYITDDTKEPKQQTLHLEWRTKQACKENAKTEDDKGKDSSSSWGFFTWIFIMYAPQSGARERAGLTLGQNFLRHSCVLDLGVVDELQSIWHSRVWVLPPFSSWLF